MNELEKLESLLQSGEALTAEWLFEVVLNHCEPQYQTFDYTGIFKFFFNLRSNFIGGCGDERRTKHENIFKLLFPYMQEQVSFGTGKGGKKLYGATRYTVDFLYLPEMIAYEIDGKSHRSPLGKVNDALKDLCLLEVHGITVHRLTNKQVALLLKKRCEQIVSELKGKAVGVVDV